MKKDFIFIMVRVPDGGPAVRRKMKVKSIFISLPGVRRSSDSGMVGFASIVGFTAYIWLLRVSTPTRVGSYAFVIPVVAVLVGWTLGGEPLTVRVIVASGVIVTGVALMMKARAEPVQPCG
jgi:hypothetical protein